MPQASQERAAEPKPIVLFLDDNLDMLQLYQTYFQSNGYSVLTSTQGENAIRLAEANPVAVAVVDYEMPEMDGLEATRRIRELPGRAGRTPIIALTANANVGFREACLAAGANDYLSKPYTEAALVALLVQWLPAPASATAEVKGSLLDRAALDARYPGNPELVGDLERLFIATTKSSLATLKQAIAARDQAACRKEAHALKGAAASVTAVTVQDAAARIETCAKNADFDGAGAELAVLDALVAAYALTPAL